MPSSTSAVRRAQSRPAGVPGPWQMFFRGFLKHPVMVGSIIPSSDKLIEKMLGPVDWQRCKLFVEYGPGVGTFCRPILEKMAPDATLLTIDTNPDFINYLRHTIADSRFVAVHGSAADVETIVRDHGHEKADYVLSGLPFSTLPTRRSGCCAPRARSWSISSAPRCVTSSRRTSRASITGWNGGTCRRHNCTGPGRTANNAS